MALDRFLKPVTVRGGGDERRQAGRRLVGCRQPEAERWIDGKATLEKLLNLAPSEDASINHFITPFLRNALGYAVGDIDIKPPLTRNEGRKVKKMNCIGDVVVRKRDEPVFVIEQKAYGHPLKTAIADQTPRGRPTTTPKPTNSSRGRNTTSPRTWRRPTSTTP